MKAGKESESFSLLSEGGTKALKLCAAAPFLKPGAQKVTKCLV